jgi:transposase-like protein
MEAKPKTLQQAIKYFSNEQVCIDTVAALRWPNGPICPKCGGTSHYYLATQKRWKCKNPKCAKQFTVKLGTIFEDSPITLDKWLIALWMLVNCKNGISSYEVGRDLGITQKSAWFVLQRLRLALQTRSFVKMGGHGSQVEVDETFIGGAARFMHENVRRRRVIASSVKGKTAVMGFLERGGEVRASVIPNRKKHAINSEISKHLSEGSVLYTDNFTSYTFLPAGYHHEVIDHAEGYVQGQVHTNGMENFWSLLKRGLKGTYISVEPFHLFRYLDEQVYRFNNRSKKEAPFNDGERFEKALSQIAGKRLTFAEVTGKEGKISEVN